MMKRTGLFVLLGVPFLISTLSPIEVEAQNPLSDADTVRFHIKSEDGPWAFAAEFEGTLRILGDTLYTHVERARIQNRVDPTSPRSVREISSVTLRLAYSLGEGQWRTHGRGPLIEPNVRLNLGEEVVLSDFDLRLLKEHDRSFEDFGPVFLIGDDSSGQMGVVYVHGDRSLLERLVAKMQMRS